MNCRLTHRSLVSLFALLGSLLAGSINHLSAQQPFPILQPSLSQSLFATDPLPSGQINGGLAFAPNGDLWADSCNRNTLLKFQASVTSAVDNTPVHPQAPGSPFSSNAGCGLTNHPDGTLYSNNGSGPGLINLDATTGAQLRPAFGPQGNGLGITVDPRTNNLVYLGGVGGSCFGTPPCTIVTANPATTASTAFAQVDPSVANFIDGIVFDPSGSFLFMAVRSPKVGLVILERSGEVVQQIPIPRFPDGVAFHTNPDYVVTNNNDGTMTRLDFPGGDFTQPPTKSILAAGGFRGDLTQVGPDNCLYATQDGSRFLDGVVSGDNSVVRICPGFVPSPGVIPAAGSFVIGDLDASPGQQVTFWGAQWANSNSMSGGRPPDSFKGFTELVPQTCGGIWTSSPGNSSKPPDSVPSFIAVIASSTVTRSGNTITGDISKIVIVRTLPGYGPSPGHSGTGVVVAVVCGNNQ